jgi:UDP-2,3-diacylglucosamine hydrolase
MVRDPLWQQEFLGRSIEERIVFAAEARKQSKSMSSNKADDIMDVTPEAVIEIMQNENVETLIHGHTHRPATHQLSNNSQRIVLGDWDISVWYISWTAEQILLQEINKLAD